MKKMKAISLVLAIPIIMSMLAACGGIGSGTASAPSANESGSPPPDTFTAQGLASSYLLDFLSPENAGDKTLYIKDPKGNISATWECTEHGFQKLTNVSFDGDVLSFNALSGTPGDEYFYFHLKFYGDYLLGYAKTREMHKSPILGTAVK